MQLMNKTLTLMIVLSAFAVTAFAVEVTPGPVSKKPVGGLSGGELNKAQGRAQAVINHKNIGLRPATSKEQRPKVKVPPSEMPRVAKCKENVKCNDTSDRSEKGKLRKDKKHHHRHLPIRLVFGPDKRHSDTVRISDSGRGSLTVSQTADIMIKQQNPDGTISFAKINRVITYQYNEKNHDLFITITENGTLKSSIAYYGKKYYGSPEQRAALSQMLKIVNSCESRVRNGKELYQLKHIQTEILKAMKPKKVQRV